MNTKRIGITLLILAVVAALVTTAYAAADSDSSRRKLVGTWVCDVPGEPAFQALHTFNADGTFTETSSLLARGEEGPAHGVWVRDGRQYQLTFQLFAFDPDTRESTGMIRVRLNLELDGPDHMVATFGVGDFIDPDGTATEIFRGPDVYTCDRLNVVPVP